MRIVAEIGNDVRFQFRHGFYYAYVLVSALYVVLLHFLPVKTQQLVGTVLLFSDPGALGAFFVGGIVLLERGQGILDQLFVTPLKMREYLISKVVSLTLLALITSSAIAFATFGLTFNPLKLVVGISLSSIFFTLLGLGIVVRVRTLNGYLLLSPLYMTIFFLPVLETAGVFSTPLFYLLPGKASLVLIEGAFRSLSGWEVLYAFSTMGVWIALAYRFAYRSFYRHVILRIGEGQG